MAPSDCRLAMRKGDPRAVVLGFVPGLPRVGAVAQHASAVRRPCPVATPHGRRAHMSKDIHPLNPLEQAVLRGVGEQRVPYRHSEEARRKISAANKGNVPWNKGRKHTEETRRKIALATKMAMSAPDVREKLRAQAVGRKHSEETKRKIRHASRKLHGSGGPKARKPVPFHFSPGVVAALDSRITKRFKKEYIEAELYSPKGGIRRPMSEATKKKLSARIKAMWSSPEYREKVMNGIEVANRSREPRMPLSQSHKDAIRQTLLKRNADFRKTNGMNEPKPRRRPRSSLTPLDPEEGTRFSERNMSPKELREREERRLKTAQLLFEAEQEEEEYDLEENSKAIAERMRVDAEREAKRVRDEQIRLESDRQLLESLQKAGQLPSLDEDGAVIGTSLDLYGEHPGIDGNSFFGTSLDLRSDSSFLNDDFRIEASEPLKDPLLCPPEPSLFSSSASLEEQSLNDVFISAEVQTLGDADLSFSSSPSVVTKLEPRVQTGLKGQKKVPDETDGISFTESVPLGQRLSFGETEEEEREGIEDSEVDEEEDSGGGEDHESSVVEASSLVPSPGLPNSIGSMAESADDAAYAREFDDIVAVGSSFFPGMEQGSKRIVTYVDGKRILQSSSMI